MENHREKQENSRRCEVKPPKWTPTHEQSKNLVPFLLKRQEGDFHVTMYLSPFGFANTCWTTHDKTRLKYWIEKISQILYSQIIL